MKLHRVLIVFALAFFTGVTDVRAQELKAGAAAVVITPELATPMAGYYSPRGAEGVHDDLYAKALVIDDGVTKAALVMVDLISTSKPFVEAARETIQSRTNIPADNILISATHSHTGPILSNLSKRNKDFGGDNPLAVRYTDQLPNRIADAVAKAVEGMTPVTPSWAIGHCDDLAFNRRFHMADGTVGWNPGKLNEKIVRPAGPTDPDVPIVYFPTPDARPVATFVNYAIHLDTVGGAQISADVPYTVSKLLAAAKGENMVTVYATGCCGDVNHINVNNNLPQKGHGEAARIGTILAGSVLRAFEDLEALDDTTVRVRRKVVNLPLPELSDEEVEKAEEVIAKNADPAVIQKPAFLDLVKAYRVIDIHDQQGAPWAVEVQVITIGEQVAFVSLPGEVFVELGLAIRQGSPFLCTSIAELANGSIGYIPNRVAYSQGNYEVVSARCSPGSGEILVDTALSMLTELYLEATNEE